MGWRGRDVAPSALTVLIFMLMIFESTGMSMSPKASVPRETSTHFSPENQPQFGGSSSKISLPHSESYAPSSSPHHLPEGRTTHSSEPGQATSTEHTNGRIGENPVSSLLPLSPPQLHYSGSSLPSMQFQTPLVSQVHLSPMQNSKENYAPHPIFQEPTIPSLDPSSPFTRNNKWRYTLPPYYEDQVISPASKSSITISKKRRHAAPPKFGGFKMNHSASHASMPSPIAKRPYAEGPKINLAPSSPPPKSKKSNKVHYASPTYLQGLHLSPIQAPLPSLIDEKSAAPLPVPTSPSDYIIWKNNSPKLSPSATSLPKPWAPSMQPKRALPPPPPNLDCGPMLCQPPLTNPSPGSPCACVLPIKIGLSLGVDLYTFFPFISELAKEIASGIFMKQNQVRIMGANSAAEDPEKTDVLIDLVPLGKSFDNRTVFLIFEKFWQRHVSIQGSYFGDYDVLYVIYPGLPPSPPSPAYIDGEAYHRDNNGRIIHPLGVDVRKQKKKHSRSLIVIIAVSSAMALFSIIGAAWLLILRNRKLSKFPVPNLHSSQHPFGKSSETPTNVGSGPNSTSASLNSNIATYTGAIKTFTLAEMERTTCIFDDSRIIGEGGFGRVYKGTLEDRTMVAVKVLKGVDVHGEREFLAEVDMLSRLHHRNLIRLMGICAEENIRCLVYELIPNGSVDSHLHNVDNGTSTLDWNSRVKIALGTARALAYLHEDSIPRVIHRDFKSSNILLEEDFTPKVSDFGLARTAMDEGKEPISTRVMGTFGYVDPEYAMTGHLLVKSDVYSYGVVLLELLTGRKPVDMSQPPGQENLVAWTRHLLTNIQGLETIIDPALGANYPRDSVAKVAAIASMCVQPEVSSRPLMSEVVQALKLVCNESDDYREPDKLNLNEISMGDVESGISEELGQRLGRRRPELGGLSASSRFTGDASGSFRRYSSSDPLRICRSSLLWQRVRGLVSGSSSEHGYRHRYWSKIHQGEGWS